MTLEAYDPADDSRRSYDVCVDALRERIEKFRCERIGPHRLFLGDCREVMPLIGKVHAVVTDPPYHLTGASSSRSQMECGKTQPPNRGAEFKRLSRGFMGQQWDGGDIAFRPKTWELALNALRPGGHLAAFSGSRTYHRMACAIEDAGFEIRDQLMWVFGSGFPKSHDVSKAIDAEERRKWAGLKIAHFREDRGLTREALGVAFGGLGDPAKSVWDWEVGGHAPSNSTWLRVRAILGVTQDEERRFEREVVGRGKCGAAQIAYAREDASSYDFTAPATEAAKKWNGFGTALKPSHEPICLARKPLSGTVAANVLEHGCGALNIDATRIYVSDDEANRRDNGSIDRNGGIWGNGDQPNRAPTLQQGRWPANLIHDNSIEVIECFAPEDRPAARFFYSPKVSSEERAGSTHPTMKPVDLMAWLIRLVTPPKGIVLDPFMGSGSTGIAAHRQGFRFIGIEQDEGYFNTAVRRLRAAYEKPDLLLSQPAAAKPVQETLF